MADRKAASFRFFADELQRWQSCADRLRISLMQWIRQACNTAADKQESQDKKY